MRMAAKRAREEAKRARIKSTVWYMLGVTCFTISMTYASVPLYRIFCQKTGFAGTVKDKDDVQDPPKTHMHQCLSSYSPITLAPARST
jgi:cytochrome c oxidase assembly protein Cox11